MKGTSVIDRLKHYREQLACLVLVVVGLNIVAALVRVALRAGDKGLATAMRMEGGLFMGLISVLLVLGVVAACTLTRPPTKHARIIALVGLALVGIGTAIAAVFLLVGMGAQQASAFTVLLEAVGGITDVLLKAGGVFVLWQLVQRAPRAVTSGTPDQADLPEHAEQPELAADKELATTQPIVARDAAAGAAWPTAGEAAQGAAATWGDAAPTGPPAKASPDLWKRP